MTKPIQPEDVLADAESFINLDGVTVRKGSIAAFLKNIELFEATCSTAAQKEAALAMIKQLAPAVIATRLHRHACFKNQHIENILAEVSSNMV